MHRINHSPHRRLLYGIWMVLILLLYAMHLVHLTADFPNNSPWNDWVKFTDEGWYLNAASRHFLVGQWYLPGDFNPAVALPIWPLLVAALFHFTNVSVVAARSLTVALFGVTLAATGAFARRHASLPVVLTIVTFAVTSPFLYAFTRLAIVEPLLLAVFSISVLLADCVYGPTRPVLRFAQLILLGFLLAVMMLTKPTAAVLYPAVIYTLWQRCYRLRFPTLQPFALVFIAAIAPYAAYLWLVAHSRLNEDFHYLFLANQFPHPATLKRWIVDGLFSTHGVLAIDRPLALGTLLLLLASALRPLRSIWRNPLFVAALLTLAGNIFFVFWRNYQPAHYYLFAYIPMAIVVTLSVDTLLRIAPPWPRRLLQCAVTVLIAGGLWKTIQIVRHPQFTLINAAIDLTDYVKRHPSSNPLLLAESGDQISLMAGLPSICDDFGTQPLRVEIVDRRPGWFAAWNSVDPHLLNEIHTQFHLQRVAAYPVMDDPTRNTLVLYRLVPLSLPEQDVAIQPQKLEMQHRPR